jgi:hypothetical protein
MEYAGTNRMDSQTLTGPANADDREVTTSASQHAVPVSGTSTAALDEVASATVYGIIELAELVLFHSSSLSL